MNLPLWKNSCDNGVFGRIERENVAQVINCLTCPPMRMTLSSAGVQKLERKTISLDWRLVLDYRKKYYYASHDSSILKPKIKNYCNNNVEIRNQLKEKNQKSIPRTNNVEIGKLHNN